ncbi:major tail protein [Gordonia phage Secretariat]|uniref:Major tail protein n=1 Tax=Gordonia phage Secretariat TaxID=2725616 RepID=A0A6M3T6P2_9CAUD|nr:major tail protein [Gordonia phage Secretariat]QJD49601.1 major tail protein [Gordonia phage Secretariat]
MTEIKWDTAGDRLYETGVDHGVLYIPDNTGAYAVGYAWNGLTSVSESPSGAEANPQYADNIKYLNLISAEEFGATIEAFTYPDAFAQCDGTAIIGGVQIAQQTRKSFGFSYRTLIGNDIVGTDFGYKLHLVYGCDAAPSEKSRSTVNDSPEAATFSWEITTNPVPVAGINAATGKPYRPTAHVTIDSTKVNPADMAALEAILYGSADTEPRMPMPEEVLSLVGEAATLVTATPPSFDAPSDTITIPTVTGVVYMIDGVPVTGEEIIEEVTTVTAQADVGYRLPAGAVTSWTFTP